MVIGILNFLTNSTHPEIAYTIHQCAHFCKNSKLSHKNAVQQIVKYLLSTQIENSRLNCSLSDFNRMIFKPDTTKGLEVYIDASFAGE